MVGFNLPRGMRDIPPEEMEKREWLLEKIKKVLKSYGFSLVEPSAIESIETLTAKCGEGVKEEIYWFKDKGGREVGLRFDLTVGLTRMAASMKGIPEPIRLACISNAWRYDEPQYGRYRCFWQWDVEIYGSEKIEADAEIILLTADVMDSVGMRDFIIRISDRKLMESFLRSIGVEKVLEVMRIIDKLKKIGKEGVRKELVKMKIKKVDDILEFAGTETKDITVLEKFCNEKSYMESLEKLRVLGELLEEAGEKRYVFDMSIVRGLDYYTGIVFEVYSEDKNAIAGGGRFDELSSIYGRKLPATGVAGGIERMLLSLEGKIKTGNETIFIAVVGNTYGKALSIARSLRRKGLVVEVEVKGRNLRKQLEYVNKKGYRKVIIVGEDDLKKGKVTVKDMISGEGRKVGLDEIYSVVSLPEK